MIYSIANNNNYLDIVMFKHFCNRLYNIFLSYVSFLTLTGCMSLPFEEVAEQGMEKKEFIEDMFTQGFGRYESIYFNEEKGIEILIPRIHFHEHFSWKMFKHNDDEPRLVIFNKVTAPLPYRPTIDPELFQEFCSGWNPNHLECAYYGDGVLQHWFHEDELSERATSGDDNAKLLLSAVQMRYDFVNNLIIQIMHDNQMTEAEAREALFWSEFNRDQDHIEASLKNAEKKSTRKKQYAHINKVEKNKVSLQSNSHSNSTEHDTYKNTHSNSTRNIKTATSAKTGIDTLIGRLIEASLNAYIDEKLGLNSRNSSLTKRDLEKIEEASRRGARKEFKKQEQLKRIWSQPQPSIGY